MTKILKPAFAGVLFWSAFYWNVVLDWVVAPGWLDRIVLILPAVAVNCAMYFLLSGRRKLEVLKNFGISALTGTLTFLYYRQSGFLGRWFGVLSPETNMTANEGWVINMTLLPYLLFYIFALMLAFAFSDLKAAKDLRGTEK